MCSSEITFHALSARLAVGDIVFIRIPILPFQKIATATGSWTNHVGLVINRSSAGPVIGESRFPLSCATNLSRFIARSESGRVAVCRLNENITPQQRRKILVAANHRAGILYDTGFDLYSQRQFCSRFVREVVEEATGIQLGEVESFSRLLARNPNVDIGFWRLWYFGLIPWQRKTVTPASLLQSHSVHTIFDGFVRGGAQTN